MRTGPFMLLLAGCGGVSLEGRVVDGMTGDPIAGPYKLSAKATSPDASLSCQFFQVDVDAQGKFLIPTLCGGTPYQLATDRDDLWLAEVDTVPDGGFPGPTDLKAWRAPKASGLYEMGEDGSFEALKTAADVKSEKLFNLDTRVLYPATVPDEPTHVKEGEYLVFVGKATIEGFDFVPLVPSGVRVFGNDELKITMEPWSYLGVKFVDDTQIEKVEAKLDPSKVVEKEKGNRVVRWVPADALPAGRYAILKDGDRRTYIVDLGKRPPREPEPAGEDGKGEKGKGGKGGKGGKAD